MSDTPEHDDEQTTAAPLVVPDEIPAAEPKVETLRRRPASFDRVMASLEQRGVTAEPTPEREAYVKHAEFERQTDAAGDPRYDTPTDCTGMLRIFDQSGPVWIMVCDECGFDVGVAMAKVDPKRILEQRLAKAGLPAMYAGREFDKSDEQQQPTLGVCRQWLRGFRPSKLSETGLPAIGLWGKSGRGKSHLLALMVETLIRQHDVDAMYRTQGELFDELQAGIDTAMYERYWQRALRVKVLALDDLGAGRLNDWRRDRLFSLIDYRMTHELPLLIATNVPPNRWPQVFGDRVSSRLRGMVLPFELCGPDRRAQGVQQTLGAAA